MRQNGVSDAIHVGKENVSRKHIFDERKKKTTTFVIVFFLMAESVGFEPTIERSPYT